ncbi:hypothetical protein EDC01DRAFT_647619 [Geopyxis carbonaria]|nr:hypothetical protein EDC01DRAFT_647619 [Geopyxis carbonaria]
MHLRHLAVTLQLRPLVAGPVAVRIRQRAVWLDIHDLPARGLRIPGTHHGPVEVVTDFALHLLILRGAGSRASSQALSTWLAALLLHDAVLDELADVDVEHGAAHTRQPSGLALRRGCGLGNLHHADRLGVARDRGLKRGVARRRPEQELAALDARRERLRDVVNIDKALLVEAVFGLAERLPRVLIVLGVLDDELRRRLLGFFGALLVRVLLRLQLRVGLRLLLRRHRVSLGLRSCRCLVVLGLGSGLRGCLLGFGLLPRRLLGRLRGVDGRLAGRRRRVVFALALALRDLDREHAPVEPVGVRGQQDQRRLFAAPHGVQHGCRDDGVRGGRQFAFGVVDAGQRGRGGQRGERQQEKRCVLHSCGRAGSEGGGSGRLLKKVQHARTRSASVEMCRRPRKNDRAAEKCERVCLPETRSAMTSETEGRIRGLSFV